MNTKMNALNIFKTHGQLWSTVTHSDETGFDFHNRVTKDKRQGVYAFVSQHGIEKVGKVENTNGVSARTMQYEASMSKVLKGKADATDRLWFESMTGPLRGEAMEFYFIACETTKTDMFGLEIESTYIRDLEKKLSTLARTEGNPMRLAGSGN